jgi:hypothetical protein
MTATDLQSLCEEGQQQLMLMDYLAAEDTLVQAERGAAELGDFDTLSRLYMPLQEARRQRRQRCGEGTVHLHLVASGPDDPAIDPDRLIEQYPQGQLLIAGWGTIEPALRFRNLQAQRRLYVETYLGAVYPSVDQGRLVAIVPLETPQLPPLRAYSAEEFIGALPPNSIVGLDNLLPGPVQGSSDTYAETMWIWEQLHVSFLTVADNETDPIKKMDAYRQAIAVDYACELAHQKLSAVAREYARQMRRI